MKHCHLFGLVVLMISILLAGPALGAEETGSATAAEATARVFAAIAADDIDSAIAMTAPVKGLPPASVREYYHQLAEHLKRGASLRVIAHVQLADTAVVVFRELGPGKDRIVDLDPAYLVRREGRWLVLFKLTEFDRPHFDLDQTTLANFGKLQEWYKEQEPKLQSLLRSGT